MQSITTNKKSFGALVPNIMFLGMMATLAAPYLVDVKNVVSLSTIAVSAVVMVLMDRMSKRWKQLKEFAFSISMISGMAMACLVTSLIK